MSPFLIFSKIKHLGLITLNRPQAMNALTHEMIIDLLTQLKNWADDPDILIVVIRSTHERAFCAGGDVRSLYDLGRTSSEAPLQFFKDEYQLNYLIAHYPKPYVPLLNGFTFGGGVGISIHSSYAIADENFLFAMPETGIGFFPDIGASYLLTRQNFAYGMYLGLLGARIKAQEALALRLIHSIIPISKFDALVDDFLKIKLEIDIDQQIKNCIKQYQLHLAPELNHVEEVHTCFKSDCIGNIKSNLERLNTPWSLETLQGLNQKSPMSLAITQEQLKRAAKSSLGQCLKTDYTLAYHFMRHQDFFEGVRALLIDKDKSPKWSDIPTPQKILEYFELPSRMEPLQLF